jgi:tRNA-specific 2-thiouridylase
MLSVVEDSNPWICPEAVNRVHPQDCSLAVVAMSGGVDSSVAAVWMHKLGLAAVGVSMQVWDYRKGGSCSKATCCAPSDFNDARLVAAKYGIPYYVFDMEEVFREQVIDRFVSEYYSGRTPNPCVECNNSVKFKELRRRSMGLGGSHVVTGHYARIVQNSGGYELHRGADAVKDQSYFLYGLLKEELPFTIFPLGHLCKPQVRELAKDLELNIASKPESQDICFVSGTVQDFIARIGRREAVQGHYVDIEGRVLGSHGGVHNYTVGQRRGLNLSGFAEPLYVVSLDSENQRVVVGPKEALERSSFVVEQINWLSDCSDEFDAYVQVRSRHRGSKVNVRRIDGDKVLVQFEQDWVPVSPGQAGVLYCTNNSRVLAGGKISYS